METEESNDEYFSSVIIQQDLSENEMMLTNKEAHQKLETRRKGKEKIHQDSSSKVSRFKLKVKYDGIFKLIKNRTKKKYCFGRQRTIYIDQLSFGFQELLEEVNGLCQLDEDTELSMCFLDERANTQLFVQVEDDESIKTILKIYEEKKEAVIYITKEPLSGGSRKDWRFIENTEAEGTEHENYEEDSDFYHSENSYHSLHSDIEDEDDIEIGLEYNGEFYTYDRDNPMLEVGATFPDVVAFRRALNHYAIIKNFQYVFIKNERVRVTAKCEKLECYWRVHASVEEDGITFVVKTMQPNHTCCGRNIGGNKHATQGWIADRIINDIKREGDIATKDLKNKLERDFGVLLPYDRVWSGKELAMQEIFGKWNDSFIQIGDLKEEIMKRNPESVVDFETELVEGNQHFQRFFIALGACIAGFLKGCRPYIGLDACHMKGKWK